MNKAKPSAVRPAPNRAINLERLMQWSKLTLLKLAAWIIQASSIWAPLEKAVERALEKPLRTLAKIICALIVLKAAARAKAPRKERRYGPSKNHQSQLRLLFGSRLRKLARAPNSKRDPRAKIAALLALVYNADREIARLARRFAHGLTRGEGKARDTYISRLALFLAAPHALCDSS